MLNAAGRGAGRPLRGGRRLRRARAFADGYTRFDDDLSPRLPAVRMRILRTAADIRKLFLRKGAGRAI